ncbi:hypothetical protein HPP92_009410 [Vanilla planifolia]|uniref:Pentatricopeptide repeat-containing protein n=1 Tax=Vanilla planifolia TaxID=51239 RepID=A0A835V861_VANPL|nr:hypothetical protein HPP92_009410 [Vanilla planifolia]
MSISKPCLILSNALMDMYAKCEKMTSALKVFEGMEKKDVISWNIIISGFSSTGAMDMACSYFREMPMRDLVSWNAMIAGLAQMGKWPSLMILFEEMLAHRVKPDRVTNVYLLSAASELGFLDQGRSIHGWLMKLHGNSDAFLGSALIEMYCKCGRTEKGLLVFELIKSKDLTSWTAMITGLAFNGHGMKALDLFAELLEGGLVPNSVTLISVLSACSHSGLVDHGLRVFSDMKRKYGVEPGVEHYGCLVDLLARSGKIVEARDVIRNMPMKPSKSMWGSILSASRDHGDIRHAKEALEKLVELNPEDDGGYVLLSNVYASCGRWSYTDKVREIMARRGIKKTVGWSCVAIDGILHYFVSSDQLHQSWVAIHSTLSGLHKEMDFLAEI